MAVLGSYKDVGNVAMLIFLLQGVRQTVGIMVSAAITYRSRSRLVFARNNTNVQRNVDGW